MNENIREKFDESEEIRERLKSGDCVCENL